MKLSIPASIIAALLPVACAQQAGTSGGEMVADASVGAPTQMVYAENAKSISAVMAPPDKEGSQLAYAHHVVLRVAREEIQARMTAIRQACINERYGACTLLAESQQSGDYPSGSMQMRLVPKAVEGVIQAGAEGAELAERSTSAEDLADAVRDTEMRSKRLKLHHQKLMELLGRKDIKGEELLGLTAQLAEVEAQLDATSQETAQQQRRIETNLLSVQFQSVGFDAESSEVKKAVRGFFGTLDASFAMVIRATAALLPLLFLLGAAVWLVRWLLRRKSRASD